MNDLTGLSDQELEALYQQSKSANRGTVTVRPTNQSDLSALSDAELQAAYQQAKPQQQPTVAEDVIKTIPSGIARGAISAAAFPRDALDTVLGWAKSAGATNDHLEIIRRAVNTAIPVTAMMPGKDVQNLIEQNVTGEFYQPKTRAGRYANTISEFAPAAAAPGGVLANLLKYAAIPGVVSEGAGELAQSVAPKLEPWARAAGAFVPAAAAAALTRPTAQNALRQYAGNATPQQLQQAEALFMEAQQLGMPITRAEAMQAVTNGATRMGDLQRVLEGQGGLQDFFAPRSQQNAKAFTNVIDNVQPVPTAAPSNIGPEVSQAAQSTINDIRGVINDASKPFYDAAALDRLSPQVMQQVKAAPGYAEAVAAIRSDPQLGRYVAGLPEDSVAFINELKKFVDNQAANAAGPMNAQRNQQRAAGYSQDAQLFKDAGVNASQNYETALAIQEQGRRQYLQPLLNGPLGKLAKDDLPTQKAIGALFPTNPLPNSAGEIATAVSALAKRNPMAARDLVRAHLESTFNEATQNLIGGQNQFGGAKFAATIRGNEQQAANLEAAIRALPNGDQIWPGVDRFLTILEAQGTRQRPGSMTAFNQELLQDLRGGTGMGNVAKGVNITQIPKKITEVWERWRLGKNVNELSRLLTDPRAAREFERLATAGAAQSVPLLGRLTFLGSSGASNTSPQKR